MPLNRRRLLAVLAALPLVAGAANQGLRARVVVVGGGFAGATAARLLKTQAPSLEVVLVEPQAVFHTCPRSNLVLAGLETLHALAWSYRGLEALGVRHVREAAREIDPVARRVVLRDGRRLAYDWLVFAPGIDFRYEAIEGHSADLAERFPHAWKAGPQTERLQRQLQAMDDGGVVLMSVPENPYRCPPGPYERASLVAHYLAQHKPRAKLLILDAKDTFSKEALFRQDWAHRHAGRIEWVGRAGDGKVVRLDAARRELECEFGGRHRGDVINLIPPQRASRLAARAGLADASGWVPVEGQGFRATQAERVIALGDACIAAPMPKSAYSAHAQARRAVAALLAELRGEPPVPPALDNTCYSLLAPGAAVSIGARYDAPAALLREVPGTLRLSPLDGDPALRAREAEEADAWYQAIGAATWGSRA